MDSRIWTVFISSDFLNDPFCKLYGKIVEEDCFVLVLDKHYVDAKGCDKPIGTFHQVGTVLNGEESRKSQNPPNSIFIDLYFSHDGNILCKMITKHLETLKCNIVIFEPQELLESYFLCWDTLSTISSKNVIDILSKEINTKAPHVRTPRIHRLQILWLFVFQFVGFLLDNRIAKFGPIKFAANCSSLLVHQTMKRQEYLATRRGNSSVLRTQLGLANACWRQLLDSLLGVVLMYFFMYYSMSDEVAAHIITWAYAVAEYLHSLVEWLMGAPAGLKLNKQLTEFLGHFFLYHIYLWKGYLGILQPVLGGVLWYSSLFGILGLTAQLCFLRDVLSVMTLHIYCFYVYAARLYQFQVYALSAFWRLFRGKKWNTLRQRLDSVRYDVDQLFLGTLLFTILLFTLPTSALYYVVFTLLRLIVLTAHQMIFKIVQTLDSLPIFSILMWSVNSRCVNGDILFTIIPQKNIDISSLFSLQVIRLPFGKLLTRSENPFRNVSDQHCHWSQLIGDLVKGRLIYPWVEVSNS